MHQVFKILFCHETLHVSGIFCAPSSGVICCTRGNLLCFMQVMWPLPRRVRLELQPDAPALEAAYVLNEVSTVVKVTCKSSRRGDGTKMPRGSANCSSAAWYLMYISAEKLNLRTKMFASNFPLASMFLTCNGTYDEVHPRTGHEGS